MPGSPINKATPPWYASWRGAARSASKKPDMIRFPERLVRRAAVADKSFFKPVFPASFFVPVYAPVIS
jgi:hypothetical protein